MRNDLGIEQPGWVSQIQVNLERNEGSTGDQVIDLDRWIDQSDVSVS